MRNNQYMFANIEWPHNTKKQYKIESEDVPSRPET